MSLMLYVLMAATLILVTPYPGIDPTASLAAVRHPLMRPQRPSPMPQNSPEQEDLNLPTKGHLEFASIR